MKNLKDYFIQENVNENTIEDVAELLGKLIPYPTSDMVTGNDDKNYELIDDMAAKVFALVMFLIQDDHHMLLSDKFWKGFEKYYDDFISNEENYDAYVSEILANSKKSFE